MTALRCYKTLDNGGRPFKVCYDARQFWVMTPSDPDADEIHEYNTTVVEPTHYTRAFVGKSPRTRMTEFSGAHGPKYDGNSMLFELRPHEYMFIGERVLTFRTPDPIATFVSPVGNSSVPYPFAVDRVGRVYMLLEDAVMTGGPFSAKVLRDPYDLYYDVSSCITMVPHPKKKKGLFASLFSSSDEATKQEEAPFEGITAFYIGNQPQTLTYVPFPERDYDRIVHFTHGSKRPPDAVSIVAQGKRYELTRQEYVQLMKRFGRSRGLAPLKAKVLHDRV